MDDKYSEEERQFLEEIAFNRLPQINEDQLREVAQKFELKDTGTKICLYKVILGYFSSIETTSFEGLKVFVELNELLDKFFIKKCLKESPQKPEDNILKSKLQKCLKTSPQKLLKTELTSENELTQITKFREFKINGKIGTPDQKEKLSFMSLIYQMNSGIEKGFSERDICEAVIKSISPDLPLRSYLEGKETMDMATLSKILRSHFKEPNSTALFTQLSNSKQASTESAQEYVIRLMSLRQKILFVSREESCSYNFDLIQNRFEHAVLVGLRNENIRNELRPILKSQGTLSDEILLEHLSLAMSDEHEHSEKFYKRRTDISKLESSEEKQIKSEKIDNKLLTELQSLKVSLDEISKWQDNYVRDSSRLPRQNNKQNLPRRCSECLKNKNQKCDHCYFCGSDEHFQTGCKKRLNSLKNPKN